MTRVSSIAKWARVQAGKCRVRRSSSLESQFEWDFPEVPTEDCIVYKTYQTPRNTTEPSRLLGDPMEVNDPEQCSCRLRCSRVLGVLGSLLMLAMLAAAAWDVFLVQGWPPARIPAWLEGLGCRLGGRWRNVPSAKRDALLSQELSPERLQMDVQEQRGLARESFFHEEVQRQAAREAGQDAMVRRQEQEQKEMQEEAEAGMLQQRAAALLRKERQSPGEALEAEAASGDWLSQEQSAEAGSDWLMAEEGSM